ncbi:MAG: ribose 5-phosphate isomerase B [Proteobacteria bacterium]|nr:ribose 5-phosphate isomerase B [Pseudomonadota bacterium]
MSDARIAQPGDTIVIASDHAGVELKSQMTDDLKRMGFSVKDLGTNSSDSVDYPDFGHAVGKAVETHEAKAGVVICGTGIGISIAANRHKGVRAALVHDDMTARMAREHNDANVMAIGARIVPADQARALLKTFFETPFEGGRHARRVEKLG